MSSNNNLNNDQLVSLHPAQSLVDAVDHILLYDHILKSSNIDNDKQKLLNLELDIKQYPWKLQDLAKTFADGFEIDLQIIAYTNEKFEIVNKYWSSDTNKLKKQAFLIFNSNYTVCGPLFVHDANGIQTVFATDDMRIKYYVSKYIEYIHRKPRDFFDETEELSSVVEEPSHDMMVDETPTSIVSNSENCIESVTTIIGHGFHDQTVQQICELYATLSPILDKAPLGIQKSKNNNDNFNYKSPKQKAQILLEQLQNLTRAIQSTVEYLPDNDEADKSSIVVQDNRKVQSTTDGFNDIAVPIQNIQNPSNVTLLPLHQLSTTTQITPIMPIPMSPQFSYAEPEIMIEPKKDWHRRYMRDVGKREMPLLSGDGPQKTLVRVKVPAVLDRSIYLCITPFTSCGQAHPIKVIVPANTKIDEQRLSHDNNFQCLLFTDCNSTDHFDQIKRHVYLEISATEREAQYKDVKVHMFNLYQNSSITKKMIQEGQLNLCKLGFCFCVPMDEQFQPISPWSFSRIIRDERRLRTQSRATLENEN